MASGERPASGWRLYSANFSVRREQFIELNGFDLAMGHVRGEDVELGFRLEEDGATYYFAEAGAAVHRGFRTFTSWCNSAYILGVRDIALGEEKDRPDLLRQVTARYRHQPSAVTFAVKAATTGTGVRKALVYVLRLGAGALNSAGMRSAAHAVYSTIFRLQYWCGVTERLGGRRGFVRFVYGTDSITPPAGDDRPTHATAPGRTQR